MGMMSQLNAKKASVQGQTHTANFPVTGFPASAYLGNNRRVGGGTQSRPSAAGGALGNASNFNPQHVVLSLAIIVGIGFFAWHLDNK